MSRFITDVPKGSETTDPHAPRGSGSRTRYFIVRGEGPFPHDMLRYDKAWALTGIDDPRQQSWRQPQRSVICATRENLCPTVDRWHTFGWGCEILDELPEWLDQEAVETRARELT